MRPKKRYYADGGKVASAKPPAGMSTRPKKGRSTVAPVERRSLMDAVGGKIRREREQALGLKDGGAVKRPRPPMPGPETRVMKPVQLPKPKTASQAGAKK